MFMPLSREYLLSRGYCCKNGCKNCPWEFNKIMSNEVKYNKNESAIPYYVRHEDGLIAGFFGQFRFLSNFQNLQNGVFLDELIYPTVENAYQAAKWPINEREQFTSIPPWEAKKLGKQAPNLDMWKWLRKKYDLMYELNVQKYVKNEVLKQKLMLTDGFVLEERNNWGDRDWGTDTNGQGENNLGKILMRIRTNLLLNNNGNIEKF